MRGARWRKVRADLMSNKLRSALAIVSLVIGTSAVGAMHLAASAVDESFGRSFAATNPPSAVLGTDPFPSAVLRDIAGHPAVEQAEGRRLERVQAQTPTGERHSVELVALPDAGANRIARITSVEGVWPPERGTITLERASVAELDVADGDALSVEVSGQPMRELTVAGIAADVFEVAPMLGGAIRAYVAMDTMADLTASDHLNAIYLRAADRPLTLEGAAAMTASVQHDVLTPAGVRVAFNAVDEPGEHRAASAVSFVTLVLQLMSLLALAIAVALVVTTLTALLAQQRSQIGVLKAIGATSRHLTVQYLAYVIALSLLALAVAVPASLGLGAAVAGFVADLANIDLAATGIPVAGLAGQAALAVVLPVTAVLLAVRRAARSTVLDAIGDRGLTSGVPSNGGSTSTSRPTVLAYRNAVRNRLRLGLTVLTVALCGAVIVGVSSTGKSLGLLGDDVAGYAAYDVELAFTAPVSLQAATDALGDDLAVTTVEAWQRRQGLRVLPDGRAGANIDLTGTPADSTLIRPSMLQGRWFDDDDGNAVVINTHLADAEPDLAIGDDLVLEVGGVRRRWHIVGVSSTTLVGPVAYVPSEQLAVATGEPGSTNLLAMRVAGGAVPSEVAQRLEDTALGAGLPLADVRTHEDIRATTDSLFTLVVAVLLLVGAILGIVAVIGVAGTMTLGVFEQTREIGVLRTLGATTWAIRRLLMLQGLAVAGIGAVAGALISLPVTLLLGAAISSTLISAAFPFSFSWLALVLWLLIAAAIGAVGTTQPARMASRLTVRDTLAYE